MKPAVECKMPLLCKKTTGCNEQYPITFQQVSDTHLVAVLYHITDIIVSNSTVHSDEG